MITKDEVILLILPDKMDTNPDIVEPTTVLLTFRVPEILILCMPHELSLKIPKLTAEVNAFSIFISYAVRLLHSTA